MSELCHHHNTYFFVDPIQSLGALQLDVSQPTIDFFSSGCYKWLMSELGISIFYIRKELIDHFHSSDIGWFSLKEISVSVVFAVIILLIYILILASLYFIDSAQAKMLNEKLAEYKKRRGEKDE